MNPSEILVAAADLIRDLAAKASPGPWESAREFSQPNVVYAKGRLVDSVGVAGRRLDLDDRIFTGQTASRSRSEYEADARWIAALSPVVAPALETILREAAFTWKQWEREPDAEIMVGKRNVEVLALAKSILGSAVDTQTAPETLAVADMGSCGTCGHVQHQHGLSGRCGLCRCSQWRAVGSGVDTHEHRPGSPRVDDHPRRGVGLAASARTVTKDGDRDV